MFAFFVSGKAQAACLADSIRRKHIRKPAVAVETSERPECLESVRSVVHAVAFQKCHCQFSARRNTGLISVDSSAE